MKTIITREDSNTLVQIVGPTDHWILEKLTRKLASKISLPSLFLRNQNPSPLPRSFTTSTTHFTNHPADYSMSDFLRMMIHRMDLCVSMSRKYADWLKNQGIQNVVHIPMGFDAVRYRPRLVVGVVGRLDHPRKGKELVEKLRVLSLVEICTTFGKITEKMLRAILKKID